MGRLAHTFPRRGNTTDQKFINRCSKPAVLREMQNDTVFYMYHINKTLIHWTKQAWENQ